MGYISREDFLKLQEERQARADNPQTKGNGVGYFNLKDNGDEALVRFFYDENRDYDILTVHDTKDKETGKFRRVNCLRTSFKESPSSCPFCAKGEKAQNRFYIKLLEYSKDENGNTICTPKIWDRSTAYVAIIDSLCNEYGNIKDYLFKIKRVGAKGSKDTQYPITLANPQIYNTVNYPIKEDAFDGYSVLGSAVLDKSFDEMCELAGVVSMPTESTTVEVPFTEQTSKPRTVSYH